MERQFMRRLFKILRYKFLKWDYLANKEYYLKTRWEKLEQQYFKWEEKKANIEKLCPNWYDSTTTYESYKRVGGERLFKKMLWYKRRWKEVTTVVKYGKNPFEYVENY